MSTGRTTNTDHADTDAGFAAFAASRDPQLRDELVRAHLPLAEYLAKRFMHRGVPLDDLFQVASLGLVKAVDRFEPERGVTFSTFATPTIVGELKRHFRDKGWALRVPRRLQELHLELSGSIALLSQELGRSPTVAEIAARSNVSEDDVLEATEVAQVYRIGSLEMPSNDEGETLEGSSSALSEVDSNLERVEERLEIANLLQALPNRERAIVHMRFFEGRTQSEIASHLGISQMHVSRLLARSIEQLRQRARERPGETGPPDGAPPGAGDRVESGQEAKDQQANGQAANGQAADRSRVTREQAMDFDVSVQQLDGVAVVAVTGELDLSTSPQLRDRLVELAGDGAKRVVVDLEGVEFLDSTGLGVLVGGLKRLRSNEGDLALICTKPRILRVFEITALTKVFEIFGSRDEAVRGEQNGS